jgi:hypothetical protein
LVYLILGFKEAGESKDFLFVFAQEHKDSKSLFNLVLDF